MARDWLHEREDAIIPLASYLIQAALLVLFKLAKGFICVVFLWSSCNILNSSISGYLPMNISNSGVGKYSTTQKVRYS
jgi:hypothetical protein